MKAKIVEWLGQVLCRYITKAIADKRILIDSRAIMGKEQLNINKELKKLDKRLKINEDLMGKTKAQRIKDTLNKINKEK